MLKHHKAKALHSIPKQAQKYLSELGTEDGISDDHTGTATSRAKMLKNKYKADYQESTKTSWKEKAMHGKFPTYLEKGNTDKE